MPLENVLQKVTKAEAFTRKCLHKPEGRGRETASEGLVSSTLAPHHCLHGLPGHTQTITGTVPPKSSSVSLPV